MDKAQELYTFFDSVKMMLRMGPVLKEMIYCLKTSIKEFASRYQDPLIRENLVRAIHPDTSLIALVLNLAVLNQKSAGFPLGGSLEFAKKIEKKFLSLDGKVFYNRRVERILVEKDQAYGIRLSDGTEIRGDIVLSASDLKTTLEKFLENRYTPPYFDTLFRQPTYPTGVQVSLGVNRKFDSEPDAVFHFLPTSQTITVGGHDYNWLHIKNYRYDPSLAPEGKTFLAVFYFGEFDSWNKYTGKSEEYRKEKQRIADETLKALEIHYPGITGETEVIDVATPLTYVRYTGNWQGRYMTWNMQPENAKILQTIPKQLQGLKNFYQGGMWVMSPGGLPSALKTARDIVQIISKKDGKKFKTA